MAPNKYGYQGNEAEQSFDQFVMTLHLSLLPAITATYHGLKHDDPERYLQRLEQQMSDYQIRPDQRVDFTVKQLRGEAVAWVEKYTGL